MIELNSTKLRFHFFNKRNLPLETIVSAKTFLKGIYQISDKTWSYAGKVLMIARHALNAIKKSLHSEPLFTKTITHLKVVSIFGIPFSVSSALSSAAQASKDIAKRDGEAFVFSSGLSLLMNIGEILDSVTTVFNAVLVWLVCDPVNCTKKVISISVGGLCLSVFLVSLGFVANSYKLVKAINLSRALQNTVLCHPHSENGKIILGLSKFLKETLGNSPDRWQQLKEQESLSFKNSKLEGLKRIAPAEAIEELEQLAILLAGNREIDEKLAQEILKRLDKIVFHLNRRLNVALISLVATLLSLVGLSLLLSGIFTPLPYCLLATSVLIRIALLVYQDRKIEQIAPNQQFHNLYRVIF